ncbi:RNA polymerase sigma factor (sigma-70 family) [Psychromicrobium silvestre]|uniref:RNA polymerase sigma factor (Sigma-70 family) n=1 Tax=Psychromicrobium silvestre TaxID=1645614 RepID=A0A7Y9LSC5_9MICC|nr:RNA polymerase sigma factor (sigma-70 family) [Psychromicrobium silvestre]
MQHNAIRVLATDSASQGSESDGQLIARVRGGNTIAFEELYLRHKAVAHAVARENADNASDAEDIVSEAFSYLLAKLRAGEGPDNFFRGYLLTAVRRTAYARNRSAVKTRPSADDLILDRPLMEPDRIIEEFESTAMVRAFSDLPERWQSVLWYLDVEQEKTQTVAERMGISANSVSALVMRARVGLRTNYLQQHLSPDQGRECRGYIRQLAKYVSGTLSKSSRSGVEDHLTDCARCTQLLLTLKDTNPAFRAAIVPAIAGISYLAYLNLPPVGNLPLPRARGLQSILRSTGVGVGLGSAAGVAAVAAAASVILMSSSLPVAPSVEGNQQGSSPAAVAIGRQPAAAPSSKSSAKSKPEATKPAQLVAGPTTSEFSLPQSLVSPQQQSSLATTPVNIAPLTTGQASSPVLSSPAPQVVSKPVATAQQPTVAPVAEPATPTDPTVSTPDPIISTPDPTTPTEPSTPTTPVLQAMTVQTSSLALLGAFHQITTTLTPPVGTTATDLTVVFKLDSAASFVPIQPLNPLGWGCDRGSDDQTYTCKISGVVSTPMILTQTISILSTGATSTVEVTVSGTGIAPSTSSLAI